jgi:hypothetical protein
MIGILVCGGSGLFIGLTHIYLVEMTQCFTAAAMMFVACRAEKRPLARTVGLGIFAVALSFLSKSSSMTFVLPMVTYMVVALFINRRNVRVGAQYPDALLIVIAGITAAAAVTWYTINWQNVVQHFINATISDYTLHWGSPVNLGVKLQFWSGWFLKSLSPFPLVSGGIVALIVASFATSIVQLYKRPTGEWLEASVQTGLLFALSLAGTIIATLFVFSLQINEDTRFLLPLIPAAGILVAWSVSTVRSPIVRMLVFSALALNAGVGHVYAHGSNPFHIAPHNYLSSVDLSPDGKALLTETVRSSCQRESAGRLNFIIVSYATLNGNTINFYSEKNGEMGGYRCSYTTFGANEVDINHALDRINAVEPSYIVTVAPDKQPPPDFVNVVSRAVSEHLAHDPQYVLAPGSGSYLLIYRNTKPSN